MPDDALDVWVVYQSPRDYPGRWVVRRQRARRDGTVVPDPKPLIVCDSLDVARSVLPRGLFRLPRFEQDEPQIVEAWI
ncbi:MAG TPA: hypothetical protein VH539_10355 [Gemmatimonadaceae bacterium]|jgi:hypothetical protein